MQSSYDQLSPSPVSHTVYQTSKDTVSKSTKQLNEAGTPRSFGYPDPLSGWKWEMRIKCALMSTVKQKLKPQNCNNIAFIESVLMCVCLTIMLDEGCCNVPLKNYHKDKNKLIVFVCKIGSLDPLKRHYFQTGASCSYLCVKESWNKSRMQSIATTGLKELLSPTR